METFEFETICLFWRFITLDIVMFSCLWLFYVRKTLQKKKKEN